MADTIKACKTNWLSKRSTQDRGLPSCEACHCTHDLCVRNKPLQSATSRLLKRASFDRRASWTTVRADPTTELTACACGWCNETVQKHSGCSQPLLHTSHIVSVQHSASMYNQNWHRAQTAFVAASHQPSRPAHTHTYIYTYTYIYVLHMCAHTDYVLTYTYVYTYIYTCMCIYICICISLWCILENK